jgi:hypothetical protein
MRYGETRDDRAARSKPPTRASEARERCARVERVSRKTSCVLSAASAANVRGDERARARAIASSEAKGHVRARFARGGDDDDATDARFYPGKKGDIETHS